HFSLRCALSATALRPAPWYRFCLFSGALMKTPATAIAAIALIATPAFAADIAVKAPPSPPPAPVYNWTGWYVGLNAGLSFGRAKTDYSFTGGLAPFPAFAGSGITEPFGGIAGGQIGFNWQFSPIWVGGIEADIQWADEGDGNTVHQGFTVIGVPTITG